MQTEHQTNMETCEENTLVKIFQNFNSLLVTKGFNDYLVILSDELLLILVLRLFKCILLKNAVFQC